MSRNLPADAFFLDDEQREEVQRLAALGYRPADIAICLGLDPDEFSTDAKTPGTTIYSLIREGLLITRAEPEMKLHKLASDGNLVAIQEVIKLQQQRHFENIVNQLDDDELG